MALPIHQIVFYVFSFILLCAGVMMVFTKNPVKAALFLILAFFSAAVLWLLLQAEFVGLVLIFVYVGAVMALFLFVVMMLNIDMAALKAGFVKLLPLALLMLVIFVAVMYMVITRYHFHAVPLVSEKASYSNIKELGNLLFSHYILAFEVTGALLLVALVSAIALAFFGRKPDSKFQKIGKQNAVTKAQRLKIIKEDNHE